MGSSNSSSKVTNLQNKSMEMNPMVKEDSKDLEEGKQETEVKPSKSVFIKRLVMLIVTVALLVEPCYSTYVAYKAYNNFGSMNDQIKLEVTDRYTYYMINDIQLQRSCNGEYSVMFDYIFPGSNIRCDCRNTPMNNITFDFCNPDQVSANCVQYGFLEEKVLSTYPMGPSNDLSQQLCMKQYTAATFATITSWPTTCPSGYRMCGGTTPESQVCIATADNCPINAMVISPTNPDTTVFDEQVQFNSTHTVFFSRHRNSQPINFQKVTSGEGPCYNITQENTYAGRVDPFNFKVQRTACEVDPRFARVAEIGEFTFYKSNDIDPQTYFSQVWSFYQISDQYRYGFYISHYPDWKYENRNELVNIIKFMNNRTFIMQYQTALLYLNVANLAINVGFAIYLIYMFVKGVSEEEKDSITKKKEGYNNTIKICQLAACIYQVIYISGYLDSFQKSAQNNVSDARTNGILNSVYNYMNTQVYKADVNMIISTAAGFVVALLGLLYQLYAAKKKQKEEENQ